MDEITPETGRPYASEEEEYNRIKPSMRDHPHTAQPLPPPVPGVDYAGDGPPQGPTCENQFPGVLRCNPNWLATRFKRLMGLSRPNLATGGLKVNTTTMADYQDQPDGKNN